MPLSFINKLSIFKNDYWYRFQMKVGLYPGLYFRLFARNYPFNQMKVTAETQICIEGFPRSANSYAVVAFKLGNPAVKVGHHLHVAGQIIKACSLHIPTLMLIREPVQAVTSFLVFQNSINVDLYLKSYLDFYRPLYKLLDQIIVVDFSTITGDLNSVIHALNIKFGESYHEIDRLSERRREIEEKLEDINNRFFAGQVNKSLYPSNLRERLKKNAVHLVNASPLLPAAQKIYQQILQVAVK